MDEGLFELIILSSGGLLGEGGRGGPMAMVGGWGRLHTPSQDPPAGGGVGGGVNHGALERATMSREISLN